MEIRSKQTGLLGHVFIRNQSTESRVECLLSFANSSQLDLLGQQTIQTS